MFIKQNRTCVYCFRKTHMKSGLDPLLATFEHLLRKVDGGGQSWENSVMCCRDCNSRRHEMVPLFFMVLRRIQFQCQGLKHEASMG